MGILDRALGTASAGARQALRLGGGVAAAGIGRLRSSSTPKDLGDADLANKVRTEIFRGLRGVDKGAIDVNAVDGAVYLRGTAKTPQQVKALEARARAIPEVKDVHNLLHLPKTPAPTRTDTPASQRRTRGKSAATPRKPRTEPRRVNADKAARTPATAAGGAESPPDELASRREGREPAPLGASEDS